MYFFAAGRVYALVACVCRLFSSSKLGWRNGPSLRDPSTSGLKILRLGDRPLFQTLPWTINVLGPKILAQNCPDGPSLSLPAFAGGVLSGVQIGQTYIK